jgi:hypothetical protein
VPLIVARRFLLLFLGALSIVLALGQRGNCQSKLNRRSGTPASSVQLEATKDDLTPTVLLAQSIERPIHANVRIVLVSPEDELRKFCHDLANPKSSKIVDDAGTKRCTACNVGVENSQTLWGLRTLRHRRRPLGAALLNLKS